MAIDTDTLTPNEAKALGELEFALSAPHTLEEIAAHLGCSLRNVSRIEARALEKLRELASEAWRGGFRSPTTLQRNAWDAFFGDGRATRSGRD